ncbi:MAG: tetratricopeptide repeat protein [Methanoregula sp.]
MKLRQILFILAILSFISCIAIPVMADDTTPVDEATQLYNNGVRTLATNNYEGAIALFDQALASNITMIRISDALLYTYQGKAYALIQLGRYNDAIQTLDLGIAEYPKDAMLWNNKGYAYFKLGKYSDAVTAYDNAIAIDPAYTGALINKGDALFAAGQYADAVTAYNKSLENDPGNVNTTEKLTAAQKAAASVISPVTILIIIIVIACAGIAGYYLLRKKPVKEEPKKKKKSAKK